MGKKRVHEIAKELNKDSKDIIATLKQHGVEVKSHMSTISDEEEAVIRKAGYNSEYASGVYEGKVLSVIESGNLNQYNKGGSTSSVTTSSSTEDTDLTWWGDLLVILLCILVVVGGVVFLAFAVKESVDIDITKGVEKLVK